MRQMWRGVSAGTLIVAELIEGALSCIVAVSALIVSSLLGVWGPYSLPPHLLSIQVGPIVAQKYE